MANQTVLQKDAKKSRKSGIELLKIIAIVLIVISHCAQTIEEKIIVFQLSEINWQLLLIKFLRFGGSIGNLIFVVSSSFFLLNDTKAKKEKAITMLLDSQLISIGIFILYCTACIVLSIPLQLKFETVLNNIFPDLFSMVWFIPAYVILYLSHPFINSIINGINQKEHFSICLILLLVYGLGGLFNGNPQYSKLLGFFIVYFLVSYYQSYCIKWMNKKKTNLVSFFSFFLILLGITIMKNTLNGKVSFFIDYPNIDGLVSVILFPMAISLFNIFINIDINSNIINYLSSCSLFVYCIHENCWIREVFRPSYYNYMISYFGEEKLLIYLVILIVVLLIGAFLGAIIYKSTIHKLTEKLALKIKMYTSKIIDFLFVRLDSKTGVVQ